MTVGRADNGGCVYEVSLAWSLRNEAKHRLNIVDADTDSEVDGQVKWKSLKDFGRYTTNITKSQLMIVSHQSTSAGRHNYDQVYSLICTLIIQLEDIHIYSVFSLSFSES